MTTGIENFRYETWELDALVEAIEPLNPFLLDKFFSYGIVNSEAAQIEWDIVEGGQRLAPFVSPYVQGRAVRSRGHSTQTITPAYIKPSKTIHPGQALVRQPGETYGGRLTPRQRMDLLLARQIKLHDDMLTNRLNWMAAQILSTAQVVVSGDDYQSVTVDFGHDSALTYATLSGGARWSQTTGLPLDDIENSALAIRRKSYGAVADTVVLDGTSWSLFRKRMHDDRNFDSRYRLGNSSADTGPRNDVGGQMVGSLAGRFDVWVYDGQYEDENGATQPFWPVNTMLVVAGGAIQGKQYFGAIQDLANQLLPTRMFHKTKLKWDPSGLELLSQSAPIIAPRRRNTWSTTVIDQ